LVTAAFTAPSEEIDLHTARAVLREFLQERTVASPLRRFIASVGGGDVPLGLDGFLDSIQTQRQRINAMTTVPLIETAPALDTVMPPPSTIHPTGIEWIDQSLGGIREGDAIGILGGTGSGKSTFAAHLAVACAKREYYVAHETRSKPRWVGLLTYEEDVAKMRPRVWSAGFQIKRSRLEQLTHPATQLSGPGNLEPYERNLYGPDEEPLCEQQRWNIGRQWMNDTLYLYDMSGCPEYPDAGRGYIPEIRGVVDATVQQLGAFPRAIVIDYAGLVCRNHIALHNMDDSRLRHMLAEFGNRCRREIAEPFKCTVIIMHQIAPAEGTRGETALLHHSMAAEARSFAENLAACACIGNPSQETGCRRLNWSKVRYQAQERIAPVTLRINDEFAILDDVGSLFTVDESGHRFVPRDVVDRVHGETTSTPSAAPIRPTRNPPNIRGFGGHAAVHEAIDDDGGF
jgi:RecA/RadA recombinase